MDQTECKNILSLNHLMKSQLLWKLIRLLLSASVFSFLLFYSSWLSFFFHSLKFYFFTFPFQLLSHAIDKVCMFLLCNGILVFLTGNSGLISSPSRSHDTEEFFKKDADDFPLESMMSETKALLMEKAVVIESTEYPEDVVVEEERENGCLIEEKGREVAKPIAEDDEEREADSGLLITHEERGEEQEQEEEAGVLNTENDKEEEFQSGSSIDEEEEEEEEEGNGPLSTEELNKKFDDFIKRMKEELRIEAQRQLVMV